LVNIKTHDQLIFLGGIIGSFILIFGLLSQKSPQVCYIIGSVSLLLAAINFRLIYFIALEMILIAGHSAVLLGINPVLQLALPVLLTIQLLAYCFLSGQLNNFYLLVGIAGVALHSIGFVYENQLIFFFGNLSIAIYAFYCAYEERTVALLWAILNTLFALITILKIIIS
jgi:hypothetical protein